MRVRFAYILAWMLSVLVMTSCSDNEILTSYEEVKGQADPVPLVFSPYVGTNIESEATTRADLSYLSNVISPDDANYSQDWNKSLYTFNSFPWFDETAALNQSWDIPNLGSYAGKKTGKTVNNANVIKDDYRFGKATSNSYIVGIYGYYDSNSANGWDQLSASPTLTANFMTNQPLRNLKGSGDANPHWEYSPLRYWPNSTNNAAKVSFISYYPFQDFAERGIGIDSNLKYTFDGYYRAGQDLDNDGTADLADLTCITPPANDAVGKDAYLFTFKQNENIENHIDFLLGLNKDETKKNIGSGIDLTMKHTLCAVMFDIRAKELGAGVTYEINSVSLEGLYGKGKVYPTTSDPVWEPQYLEEGNTTYTLDFYEHRDIFNGWFEKPIFTENNKIRYSRQLIYQNHKQKSEGTIVIINGDKRNIKDLDYVPNSRGMECLMLVIPQDVEYDKDNNLKNAFLVVNYDITYKDGDHVNVFRNNEEKIKLKNQVQGQGNNKRNLFMPGRFLVFNILFEEPGKITMEAHDTDWASEEELILPTDDEDSGSGS